MKRLEEESEMARKALLVGINDYKGISDLRGCVNDVTNIRNILKTYFGFRNSDIHVLLDSRATEKNIEVRLKDMVKGAKSGDFLVFHFSGHGSQIRDWDGDELSDSMDELICPYDMDWDGTYITDDKLNKIFSKLKNNVLLEVFLDCCHSGTGLREASLGRPADLGPEHPTLNRFLPPPADIACRLEGEEDEIKELRKFVPPKKLKKTHILWAGCRDNQTSADAYIDGDYNGAFSYYLCKHIRKSNGQIARNELIARIRNSLSYNGYSQVPQLEINATYRGKNFFRK